MVYTGDHESVNLCNFFRGHTLFLCVNGRSLAEVSPLIRGRGIVTMGVNNGWSVLRPNLWCCVDPPSSFHDLGWLDPGIIKFVPHHMLRSRLRAKVADGVFKDLPWTAADAPAVFGYRVNTRFNHRRFFDEETVNYGSEGNKPDTLGIEGKRSVMLAALRLAVWLGFRTINIVGADFQMKDGEQNYAFPQDRDPHAVRHNNLTFDALNARFAALLPALRTRKVQVYNCTPNSRLTAFPMRPIEEAISLASYPDQLDTEGWYTQGKANPVSVNYADLYERLYQKGYNRTPDHAASRVLPYVLENLQFDSALEIGCGFGDSLAILKACGKEAVGVDISETAVREASGKGRKVSLADARSLPFPDGSFDLVYSADVMEHLVESDVPRAVAEQARVARKFVAHRIACWAEKSNWHQIAGHNLHLTVQPLSWWIEQYVKAGLTLIYTDESRELIVLEKKHEPN